MKLFGFPGVLVPALMAGACSAGPAPGQTGPAETAREIREACADAGGNDQRSACYDARLGALAKGDVREALDVLSALADQDQRVARDGHMFVHAVGIAAYDPGKDFAETFRDCTELFHAGCYHGLIQAHFAAVGQVDGPTINALCAEVSASGADRWTTFQCLHGIGHGLVIHHEHDLIEGLEGCDLLTDPWSRSSCYGGAFMENVTNATHPHHAALTESLDSGTGEQADHAAHGGGHGDHAAAQEPFAPIDPDDPHYPCTIVQVHHKIACYGMQTAVILHLNGHDFAKAAETCDGAEEIYRATCHSSLGRDASGFANRNARELARLCSLDRSPDGSYCYVGAAKAVIDWAGNPADGADFCLTVKGDVNRVRCFQAVGQQVAIIISDPARGRAVCERAEGGEREACLWGAGMLTELPAALRALDPNGA